MSGGAATATALVAPGAETQDAVAEGLTAEQRRAAGTHAKNLFIEAGPGTGKTTVSAYRFA